MKFIVTSCYKYVQIKNPEKVKKEITEICKNNSILGRILISSEGINAAFCSTNSSIKILKDYLKQELNVDNFKDQKSAIQVYHKIVIRIRKEIVNFSAPVDFKFIGKYIEPSQLNNLYETKKEFYIVDARNNYEFQVGHFKDAINLNINTFREFKNKIKDLSNLQDKKLILYCTGGIRCEKATAYLRQNGFSDVSHLHGGIISFENQFPNTFFKGSNFVFDNRLTTNCTNERIGECFRCKSKTDQYINCHNTKCDKLFLCCKKCQKKFNLCCSNSCEESPTKRKIQEKPIEILGKISHYYSKIKVAELKTIKPLKKGQKIYIKGKQTPEFLQTILQMRSENQQEINNAKENQIISIKVDSPVKKNDIIFKYL